MPINPQRLLTKTLCLKARVKNNHHNHHMDQQGNAEADTAIYAWRRLLRTRSRWYPIMLDLHRFMTAIARVSANHDGRGGTALIPWFGIRGVDLKLVSLLSGLILILRLFLALLVS